MPKGKTKTVKPSVPTTPSKPKKGLTLPLIPVSALAPNPANPKHPSWSGTVDQDGELIPDGKSVLGLDPAYGCAVSNYVFQPEWFHSKPVEPQVILHYPKFPPTPADGLGTNLTSLLFSAGEHIPVVQKKAVPVGIFATIYPHLNDASSKVDEKQFTLKHLAKWADTPDDVLYAKLVLQTLKLDVSFKSNSGTISFGPPTKMQVAIVCGRVRVRPNHGLSQNLSGSLHEIPGMACHIGCATYPLEAFQAVYRAVMEAYPESKLSFLQLAAEIARVRAAGHIQAHLVPSYGPRWELTTYTPRLLALRDLWIHCQTCRAYPACKPLLCAYHVALLKQEADAASIAIEIEGAVPQLGSD